MLVRIKTWDELKNKFDGDKWSLDVNGLCFDEDIEDDLPGHRIVRLDDWKWNGWKFNDDMIDHDFSIIKLLRSIAKNNSPQHELVKFLVNAFVSDDNCDNSLLNFNDFKLLRFCVKHDHYDTLKVLLKQKEIESKLTDINLISEILIRINPDWKQAPNLLNLVYLNIPESLTAIVRSKIRMYYIINTSDEFEKVINSLYDNGCYFDGSTRLEKLIDTIKSKPDISRKIMIDSRGIINFSMDVEESKFSTNYHWLKNDKLFNKYLEVKQEVNTNTDTKQNSKTLLGVGFGVGLVAGVFLYKGIKG